MMKPVTMESRSTLVAAGGLLAGLFLMGATCGETLEIASFMANDWLAITCQNNSKTYCASGQVLSAALAVRLQEQRTGVAAPIRWPVVAVPQAPTGSGYPEGSGYPQGTGYPEGSGYPQGTGYPQGSGYPQGTGSPQGSGYPQGTGYPEGGPNPMTPPTVPEAPVEWGSYQANGDPGRAPYAGAPGVSGNGDDMWAGYRGGFDGLGVDEAVVGERGGDIADGATVASDDRVRVAFRVRSPSFVYLFAIDTWGTVSPLFPAVGATNGNPVSPDQTIVVPTDSGSLELGSGPGVAHVYLVVSKEPRDDLERARASFLTRPRSVATQRALVGEPTVIGLGAVTTRDLPPPLTLGADRSVTPRRYQTSQPGEELLVTRWFRLE